MSRVSYYLKEEYLFCPYRVGVSITPRSGNVISFIVLLHSVRVKKPKGHVYYQYKGDMTSGNSPVITHYDNG